MTEKITTGLKLVVLVLLLICGLIIENLATKEQPNSISDSSDNPQAIIVNN